MGYFILLWLAAVIQSPHPAMPCAGHIILAGCGEFSPAATSLVPRRPATGRLWPPRHLQLCLFASAAHSAACGSLQFCATHLLLLCSHRAPATEASTTEMLSSKWDSRCRGRAPASTTTTPTGVPPPVMPAGSYCAPASHHHHCVTQKGGDAPGTGATGSKFAGNERSFCALSQWQCFWSPGFWDVCAHHTRQVHGAGAACSPKAAGMTLCRSAVAML